jgi:hypothetical protein
MIMAQAVAVAEDEETMVLDADVDEEVAITTMITTTIIIIMMTENTTKPPLKQLPPPLLMANRKSRVFPLAPKLALAWVWLVWLLVEPTLPTSTSTRKRRRKETQIPMAKWKKALKSPRICRREMTAPLCGF